MSLFCASHIREREKDTHTHRERKECRNCQHRSIAGEKERERENQSGLEKTASKQPKRNERDFREKNKSKEEEKTL